MALPLPSSQLPLALLPAASPLVDSVDSLVEVIPLASPPVPDSHLDSHLDLLSTATTATTAMAAREDPTLPVSLAACLLASPRVLSQPVDSPVARAPSPHCRLLLPALVRETPPEISLAASPAASPVASPRDSLRVLSPLVDSQVAVLLPLCPLPLVVLARAADSVASTLARFALWSSFCLAVSVAVDCEIDQYCDFL